MNWNHNIFSMIGGRYMRYVFWTSISSLGFSSLFGHASSWSRSKELLSWLLKSSHYSCCLLIIWCPCFLCCRGNISYVVKVIIGPRRTLECLELHACCRYYSVLIFWTIRYFLCGQSLKCSNSRGSMDEFLNHCFLKLLIEFADRKWLNCVVSV